MLQAKPEHQRLFESIVATVDGLKCEYEKSLADLERMYAVVSQQAFSGELDLSRIPVPDVEHGDQGKNRTGEPTNYSVTDPPFELPAPADVKKLKSAQGRKMVLKKLADGVHQVPWHRTDRC